MFSVYLNIFWRTFAALESSILFAAMAWDWSNLTTFKVNAGKLAFLSLVPLGGAVAAAYWAYKQNPAKSALEKAIRAAAEKFGAGVVLLAINTWADVLALPNLLVPVIAGAVIAFVWTFLSYQGEPPVPDTT